MDDPSLDCNTPGREIAVAAEALYLANLMIVPGIAFAAAYLSLFAVPRGPLTSTPPSERLRCRRRASGCSAA